MEQARYWMLSKRGHEYLDESWEEKAFAEDAAGLLGGCVWPPRSYTCSFCRREFRSAQALGGHMNVHRRDRARLKQFPCSPNDQVLNPARNDSYHNDLYSSLAVAYSTHDHHKQDYGLVSGNPNPESHQFPTIVSIPHKISTLVSSQEGNTGSGSKQILTDPRFSSFVLNHKTNPCFSSPNPEFGTKKKELGFKNENYHDKSGLAMSLVFQQNCWKTVTDDDDAHNQPKKRKIDLSSSQLLVIPKLCEENQVDDDDDEEQSKVYGLKSSSIEELDLELRLGDRPKV